MILGSGLTEGEQCAFDILIRFFDGEQNAERKALALCKPFAVRTSHIVGKMSEETISDTVMLVISDYYNADPEIEYLWGERRDNRRQR